MPIERRPGRKDRRLAAAGRGEGQHHPEKGGEHNRRGGAAPSRLPFDLPDPKCELRRVPVAAEPEADAATAGGEHLTRRAGDRVPPAFRQQLDPGAPGHGEGDGEHEPVEAGLDLFQQGRQVVDPLRLGGVWGQLEGWRREELGVRRPGAGRG